ncbi:MAG TPA: hypothetical protein VNA20_14495 [Frankiaceae bacterium]|nr:hypothetical protein [Frankiaceae bacterium]
MEALDAVAPLVAVLAPATLVLRDAAAYDRAPVAAEVPVPGAEPMAERDAEQAGAADAGGAGVAGTLGTGEAHVAVAIAENDLIAQRLAEPVGVGGGGGGVRTAVGADDGGYERVELSLGIEATVVAEDSVLSGLRNVEPDEQSAVRRLAAFVLLLVITLGTAGLVAAVIYNAVSVFR